MPRLLPVLASVCAALVMTGCFQPPPSAPEELNALTRHIFREFNNEDPVMLEDGIRNLLDFLTDVDPNGSREERSFTLEPIGASDVEDVDRPRGRNPDDCYGISVARMSRHSVEAHARLQAQPEQLSAEPTAKTYVRELDGNESCFVARECDHFLTTNDVRRENFLIGVSFVLKKEFRWVDLDVDGEQRWALVGRSWAVHNPKTEDGHWPADKGPDVLQSYSVDVSIPDGDGAAWRYQALYSEGEGDLVMWTVTMSTDDSIAADDSAIEELGLE